MSELNDRDELLGLTSEIVSAYLSNNILPVAEIPGVIEQVFTALSSVSSGESVLEEELAPAVPVDESVTPEHIICLEDGKKLKMLKRYLRTAYDMSPDEYRARWGLPADYPMVSPNYAKKRSRLAKDIGLGK